MMNSKEALKMLEVNGTDYFLSVKAFKIIKQDLEQLEIANKNNEGLARENVKLINKIFELEKENEELKEHSTELFDRCALLTLKVEELKKENQELKDELKRSQETINAWMENHKKLIIDNGKMKKAIEILKEKSEVLEFGLDKYEWCEETNDYRFKYNFEEVDYEGQVHYTVTIFALTKEEYELLKKVFESVGGDDE